MNALCVKALCCRRHSLMCEESLLERNLSGTIFIVTGGHSGLGRSFTCQLLKQGATVVVGCRNPQDDRCTSLFDESSNWTGSVHFETLDLSLFESVRTFVAAYIGKYGNNLHCLVNNGGIMGVPTLQKSIDGFELQFQTNYLSPFLLTELLLPLLKQSASSTSASSTPASPQYVPRVVNISSSNAVQQGLTGPFGHLDLDDVNFDKRSYGGMVGYGQSKLCQILHARELSRRLEKSNVLAVSLHPGSALSNITRNMFPYFVRVLISPSERCLTGQINAWSAIQTHLHCALSYGKDLESGEFYSQVDSPLGTKGGYPLLDIDNPQATSIELANALFRRSMVWSNMSGTK